MLGSGVAATMIVEAVQAIGLAAVEAVVDPAVSEREWAQRLVARGCAYRSIEELPLGASFDVVCVAVPTPRHAGVLTELLKSPVCGAVVLSEKPLTAAEEDATFVRQLGRSQGIDVRTLLHFCFAPEVVWLRKVVGAISARFGPITQVVSYFGDNYGLGDLAAAQARFASPWLDSGINSLSVVLGLVDVAKLVSRAEDGDVRAAARFEGSQSEDVLIVTAWDDADRRKQTCLRFGDTMIVMDHNSRSVAIDGCLVYRSVATEPAVGRYGRLMQRHLGGGWTLEDAKLESEVLRWLYAANGASV